MTATEPAPSTSEPTPAPSPDVAALLLDNTLLRAGVDLESEQGQILRDSWAGKELDAAAIGRQWELLKPQPAAAPTPPPEPDPRIEGEEGQAGERQALAGQPTTTVTTEVDVRDASVEAAREAGRKGATREDQIATGFAMRARAAGQGDTAVLVQQPQVG